MKMQFDNDTYLYHKKWACDEPKACILLIHGMAEHIERYHGFASYLTENNYMVYAYDQRGHGQSVDRIEDLGYFGEKGWLSVVEDIQTMLNYIKKEFDGPVILMGHSMGSFLSRHFASMYSQSIDGLILSGTGGSSGLKGRLMAFFASVSCKRKGPEKQAKFISKLMNDTFLKHHKHMRTEFDWLSRDTKQVDYYINDPYCGTVFSNAFYRDLFNHVEYVNSTEAVDSVRKDLPVYLFSGDEDPVGSYGKGVQKTYDLFKILGQVDLEIKLYKDGRHEMLNDINKSEVYSDVLSWLEKRW